eukprot:CAMPEP_0178897898 /NCGR_PEP_ID=MMETSP0786-20121207/2014_1 /TAXON_ID=186022 /ORGANISM="Thalassionema frauenfeldii, Strain CCMP 1798" /LENGTH=152 /DNA_ID=CAMNT_0020568523 /DNA_START=212 /DNA_END=670 /DNA_ORIENTATION=+
MDYTDGETIDLPHGLNNNHWSFARSNDHPCPIQHHPWSIYVQGDCSIFRRNFWRMAQRNGRFSLVRELIRIGLHTRHGNDDGSVCEAVAAATAAAGPWGRNPFVVAGWQNSHDEILVTSSTTKTDWNADSVRRITSITPPPFPRRWHQQQQH